MKEFRLIRVSMQKDSVCGVLVLDHPICVTLELPWLDNLPSKSCIPVGRYLANRCKFNPNSTAHYGWTYELADVPDRSGIVLHIGNWPADTRGCILLGSSFFTASDSTMLVDSRMAFVKFLAAAADDPQIGVEITQA